MTEVDCRADAAPGESAEMAFHRQVFNAVENIDEGCDADDCNCQTNTAACALLAVIWIHCPAEWYQAVMRRYAPRSYGLCRTCGVRYPCRNITAIADEFGLKWTAP